MSSENSNKKKPLSGPEDWPVKVWSGSVTLNENLKELNNDRYFNTLSSAWAFAIAYGIAMRTDLDLDEQKEKMRNERDSRTSTEDGISAASQDFIGVDPKGTLRLMVEEIHPELTGGNQYLCLLAYGEWGAVKLLEKFRDEGYDVSLLVEELVPEGLRDTLQ